MLNQGVEVVMQRIQVVGADQFPGGGQTADFFGEGGRRGWRRE